jgi:hypothetical protein
MTSSRRLLVAMLFGVVASCGPTAPGWQGTDVHLVDGTWIGTESVCGNGEGDPDLECRTVVELALQEIPPDLRARATRVTVAALPTEYVSPTGEVRTARLSAGILRRKAVVLDLMDGTRRVIGLWCHLPYSGSSGRFMASEATCAVAPLDIWTDGNEPPIELQAEVV